MAGPVVVAKIEQDKLVVTQANKLIEASYTMTLEEKRVVLLMVSLVRKDDQDFQTYRIPITDIRDYLGLRTNKLYDDIKRVADSLLSRVLHIAEEGGGWLKVGWVASARYVPKGYKGAEVACLDLSFSPEMWAAEHGHHVDYLSSYFDVTGANRSKTKPRRRALTKIDLADGTGIIPDCVFHLTDPDGTPRLFVLEMYNQYRTKRMADKLAEYRYAIGERAIEKQFDYPHSPRILAVFEDDKALELTQRHLSQRSDFGAAFFPFFFFNTLPGVMADFRDGWRKIGDGGNAILF